MATDPDLIRRARGGDEEAVAALIAEYARLIRFLAKKRLRYRDPGTFDDLVQEGRIAVWDAAKTFDFEMGPSFSSWVSTLAKQRMFHCLKHSGAKGWRPTTCGHDFSETLLDTSVQVEPDAYDELNAMLAALTPRSRALIREHYGFDGATPQGFRELAVVTGEAMTQVHARHRVVIEYMWEVGYARRAERKRRFRRAAGA